MILIGLLGVTIGCKDNSENLKKSIAVIGTYTQKEGHVDGKGAGVLIYETGSRVQEWKLLSTFSNVVNPSFVCPSPNHPIIYAVSEQGPGVPEPGSVVKVIRYDTLTYEMQELQSISAQGDAPCYISASRDGKFVFVANYVTGNVVSYSVRDDGTLDVGSSFQATGSGPHSRQEGPHAHYIKQHPVSDAVYSIDLGTDLITKYAVSDSLQPIDSIQMERGSGPRHIVWDKEGKNVYILNELTGTLEHWRWDSVERSRIAIVSLMPQGDTKDPGGGDIHISSDGKYIYASLRGDYNEIVVLSVDDVTGKLTIIQRIGAGGEVPRNFAISPEGNYVAVALQNSDKVTVFARDSVSGKLNEIYEEVNIMTPVCIVYL